MIDVKVHRSENETEYPFIHNIDFEDLEINKMIIESDDITIKKCKINLIIINSGYTDSIYIRNCKIKRLIIMKDIEIFSVDYCGIKHVSILEPPIVDNMFYPHEKIKDYSRHYYSLHNKYLYKIL